MRNIITRSVLAAFQAGLIATAAVHDVRAQSNASGTIVAQVSAGLGESVEIMNTDTGVRRSATPDSNGRAQFASVPTGNYKVVLSKAGAVVSTQTVQVVVGESAEVVFAAGDLQVVQVVGRRQSIDVTNPGATTTFTAEQLQELPIAHNVGAIIQLAPGTTKGDSRYGGANAPSFGGAGASENAYYINGFPVTTLLTQVGFAQLPYDAIAQAQVLTGGYSAEFGRSTGGVVNIITKSGTNDWLVGGLISWEPNSLRSKEKDRYYDNNGGTLAGKLRLYDQLNTREAETASVYVSGPIIKDKLFVYLAGELPLTHYDTIRTANASTTYTASAVTQSTAFQQEKFKDTKYVAKLDWNITDDHHLEYTRISDKPSDEYKYYGFDYKTLQRTHVQNGGQLYENYGPTPVAAQNGASVDILKYTGYLTQDLTVTALVGKTRTDHVQVPAGYDPNLAQVASSSATEIPAFSPYSKPQGIAGNLLVPGAYDENKGLRFDIEWKATSQHDIRLGVDYNKITSFAGSALAGGALYTYGLTDPTAQVDRFTQPTNTVAGNPYAQQGYYVSRSVSSTSSKPTVDQSALYIEDRYQITNRLLLSLGLRNEAFNNKNGDGESYIKLSKQLAPRLGAVWDVNGDASFKINANAGRYHVPLPTNVAVRGAGSSLNAQQNFVYTGVDANGIPTGLTPISPLYSVNNELGQAKDPRQVAAQNMKGNYQDELSLGFEKAYSKAFTYGANVQYRKLQNVIDDFCDDRPFIAWAARQSPAVDASKFGFNCALFNPGVANHFTIDLNGDGQPENIFLSAADLGYPKVKRTYLALDLFAEHPFDGKWWGKINYTLSKNSGNTEGQLLSDIGQADVATTQAFDFPEFSANADGLLPNNRTQQVKLFGYYQVLSELGIGGNGLIASGRPKNCIGNAPDPVGAPPPAITNYSGYGSAYFFCNGVASPRGSRGNLPASYRLDMNLTYQPALIPGLAAMVDVLNVFNRQSIETIEERYNASGGSSQIRTTYNSVLSYSEPRYVKLTLRYDKKF